jgi:hypothetical protein
VYRTVFFTPTNNINPQYTGGMLLVEGECRQNLQAADLLARQSGRTLQIYQCSRFVKRYSRLFWISADHRINIHLESVLVRDLHALQHALVPRLVPLHPDVTVLPILVKIFQLARQCSGSVCQRYDDTDPDPSIIKQKSSVPDVFGPPGSGTGSISTRYGSGSGSFYNKSKIV